jgi:hypothetical protein
MNYEQDCIPTSNVYVSIVRGGASPKVLVRDLLQCTKTLLLSHWSLASQVVALGCAVRTEFAKNYIRLLLHLQISSS